MLYSSDPYGRRRRMQPTRGAQGPTLEDYQALAQAYQDQKAALEKARKQLAETNRELGIKDEALQRQGADLKHLESELMWARAALDSQDPRPAASRAASGQSASGRTGAPTADGAANDMPNDIAAWRERYLRLQAELDNLRKRWEQRFETESTEARHQILRDMLPLADHLELAIRHGGSLQEGEGREFLRNVEATLRAFLDTLQRYQVQPIDALGQTFDPEIHEAMGQIHEEGAPPNTVVQVVQTGYREGERLLRPARVLISQDVPGPDGNANAANGMQSR
ncbi:MAG: nucleotide exchange factor GrpE [Litorilinea sp.]